MAAFAAAMGAVQLGMGLFSMIKNSKDKAPIDSMPPPPDTNSSRKYERIFDKMAQELPAKEAAIGEENINRGSADTIARAERLFKDPVLRFRAANVINSRASLDKAKVRLASLKGKSELFSKAGRFGLSADHTELRVWDSLLNLKNDQQRLYNERQYAAGEAIGSGLHNVSGALDPSNQFETAEEYAMSKEAYNQAKAASGNSDEFPNYKAWKYENFGK